MRARNTHFFKCSINICRLTLLVYALVLIVRSIKSGKYALVRKDGLSLSLTIATAQMRRRGVELRQKETGLRPASVANDVTRNREAIYNQFLRHKHHCQQNLNGSLAGCKRTAASPTGRSICSLIC